MIGFHPLVTQCEFVGGLTMDYMYDIKPVVKMKKKKALGWVFDCSRDIRQQLQSQYADPLVSDQRTETKACAGVLPAAGSRDTCREMRGGLSRGRLLRCGR